MAEPGENSGRETEKSYNGPSGYIGETDRVNGEYHYKNGYTQRIYSDAHYVPADDTTEPPRYYEPPEKKQPPKKDRSEGKSGKGTARVAAACLACLIAGGACGAWFTADRLTSRIQELENNVSTLSDGLLQLENSSAIATEQEKDTEVPSDSSVLHVQSTPSVLSNTDGALDAADIYDMACRQVVGITTDVTYTNYFGRTTSSAVSGSGFFITEDGYILTNYHVIEYAYQYGYSVTVMTYDGTRYDAAIVGVDDSNDIAVLKVDTSNAEAASIGDSSELRVGDDVYAVGNPLGELEFSMAFGHVSALDRLISTDESSSAINMFQIDAAVNSGNSGGPVYDQFGHVVGVVTAKYSESGVEGLGFAIPINDAAVIANDIITVGYVTGKASLSVTFDSRYSSVYSQYYSLPEGAYVAEVKSGGCGAKAGIQAGDIITQIGSSVISSYTDVNTALKQYSAGDTADVVVYRSGETDTFSVTFDEAVPQNALN